MSARIHLAAIAIIILLLLSVYAFSNRGGMSGGVEAPIAIEIVNASYGLNCLKQLGPTANKDPIYKDDNTPKIRKNNVLVMVSRLCNGLTQCQFKVDEATLKFNPHPSCYKDIEIDYRCFSYDRLRSIKTSENNAVSLVCPKTPGQ